MKVTLYLLFLITCFSYISCQKELRADVISPGDNNNDNDSTNSIIGTWKFASIEAKTENSSELNLANINQKIQFHLDYLTTENDGTVVIDDTAMHCTGIAYKILSKIKSYRYKNNVLLDSFETPYNRTFPATDSYTPYKIVSDSIYFKKSAFTNIAGARFKFVPSVARMQLKDDLLIFTQNVFKDTIENISGIKYHTIQEGVATMTFRRQ